MASNDAILALPESQRRQMLNDARRNVFGHYTGSNDEATLMDIDRRMHEHFGIEMDTEDYWRPRTKAEQQQYDQKMDDFRRRLEGGEEDYPAEPPPQPTDEEMRRDEAEEMGDDLPPGEDNRDEWTVPDDPEAEPPPDQPAPDDPAGGDTPSPDGPSDEDPEAKAKKTTCPGGNCDPSLGDIAVEFGKGVWEGLVPQDAAGWAMLAGGLLLSTTPLGAAFVLGFGIGALAGGAINLWSNWGTLGTLGQARGAGRLFGGILPFLWGAVRPKRPVPELPPEKPVEVPEKPPEVPEPPAGEPEPPAGEPRPSDDPRPSEEAPRPGGRRLRDATHELFQSRYGDPVWQSGKNKVWMTKGEPPYLVGDHASLLAFKRQFANTPFGPNEAGAFRGWDSHHLIEAVDLKGLGVEGVQMGSPGYNELPAVLLPPGAHGRITSILSQNRPFASVAELKRVYAEAYASIGLPPRELTHLVNEISKMFG